MKAEASRTGPESCVGGREAVGEALTGESTDRVLSCEIKIFYEADAVSLVRKAIPE